MRGCDSLFAYFTPSVTGCSGGVTYTYVYIEPSGARHVSSVSSYTFNLIGSWTVTVIANCGGTIDSSSRSGYVVIDPGPTISFTSSTPSADTGLICGPHTINYINTSIADTTCPSKTWTWIFSGPTGSFISHAYTPPAQTYSVPGCYSVTLIFIAPSCGCSGSYTRTNYVCIDAPATACFTSSTHRGCEPPYVKVDSALCSTGATSYLWHFGDGTTSTTGPVVAHTYSTAGRYYSDTLDVFSTAGCRTRIIHDSDLYIGNLGVTMRIDAPGRDTICEGSTIQFSDTVTGGTATTYDYHLYTTSGTSIADVGGNPASFTFDSSYTVTCGSFDVVTTVTDAYGCTATASRRIFVRCKPVITAMSADTLYKCAPNLVEHFHATASPSAGITYIWAYSSAATATFSGTGSAGSDPTYTYTASGTYSPRLVIRDAYGCTDTARRNNYIYIGAPTRGITTSADSGCVGLTVHFRIDASPAVAGTAYMIDSVTFGDTTAACYGGGCADSAHTYVSAGIFPMVFYGRLPAYLGGCTYTDTTWVKIGAAHPIYALSISPNDSVCPNTTIQFTANCSNCTYYDWIFHGTDGTVGTVSASYPIGDTTSYFFGTVTTTPPGRYAWSLVMSFNGCTDTVNDTVLVLGPRIGTLTNIYNCQTRDSVTFILSGTHTTTSLGNDSINYWYLDGATTPVAITTGATPVTAASGEYRWSRRFSPGWHYIRVKEYGVPHMIGGIPDTCFVMTRIDSFFIGNPVLTFTASDTVICAGETVNFTGPLQPDGTTYQDYEWFFNDPSGSEHTLVNTNSHTYNTRGTFPARIILVNSSSCRDTTRFININVIGVSGGFTVSNDTLCVGDLFTFRDNNTAVSPYAITTRRWLDGTTPFGGSSTTPTRSWGFRGAHIVTLSDTDNSPHHCGIRQTRTVYTVKPYAYFTSSDSASTVCPYIPICFHDTNTHCTYSWNFGDAGSGSGWSIPSATAQDTCHTYTANGAWTVRCAIYSDGTGFPAGCADTFVRTAYITTAPITATSSDFNAPDSASCPPLHVVRYGDTPSYSYTWRIDGTGGPYTFTGPLLNTSLLSTGVFTVTMIATSPRHCVDSVHYTYFIGGPTGFISLSDTSGCAPDSIRFHFTNTGVSITSNYIWNMCPYGSFSTTGDTTFVFPTAGVYCPPTLTIQSGTCVVNINNFTDSIRIHPTPTISISGGGLICYGASTTLVASGADYYTWTPSTGLAFGSTDTAMVAPSVSPTTTTTYLATGYTLFGCVDTALITVNVNPPIHLTISGRDSMCIGSCDTLIASGLVGASYVWRGVGTSCAVCDTNIVCITSTKTFTVSATDGAGCSDSTTFRVTVNPAPIIHVTPDPVHVCNKDGGGTDVTLTGAANYIWHPRIGLSCDSCANPHLTPTSNIIYSVTGISQFGCKDSIVIPVVVYDSVATSVYHDTSICRGDAAHLLAFGGESYLWKGPFIDNPTSYSVHVRPTANQVYTVYVHENECFDDTLTVKVRVVQIPVLTVPPGGTIIAGSTYQLYANYGDTANFSYLTNFIWTPADSTLSCFDCPRPIATPTATTTYSVVASTIEGCAASATVTIRILCEGSQVFIPNTFTPNGDGVNDRFYVSGQGLGNVTKMAIYNRWGEMVFEGTNGKSNDPGQGWDGSYKGEILTPDVFIYVIEVQCTTGETFTFRGDISLIR